MCATNYVPKYNWVLYNNCDAAHSNQFQRLLANFDHRFVKVFSNDTLKYVLAREKSQYENITAFRKNAARVCIDEKEIPFLHAHRLAPHFRTLVDYAVHRYRTSCTNTYRWHIYNGWDDKVPSIDRWWHVCRRPNAPKRGTVEIMNLIWI